MAVRERLKTSVRLKKMGISDNENCQICAQHIENTAHLFFGCEFSDRCIRQVAAWLGIGWNARNLPQTCGWIRSRYRGSRFRRQVVMAAIAATIYLIWCNRNKAFWENIVNSVDSTLKHIKFIVKK
ncbi:uncharacterized protein LOC104899027 [Beta vulgaris subsp. vulgaris]|uniref:uncharacterized protein LOC104899027 n=1 Tax=Beta vulgaris subsp. vulgaris TaxID=3555 RepID=UPI00053FE4AA|nr:uncharacterized protein LOC104899027 [Beta vulgaris subsp. vulgaris]